MDKELIKKARKLNQQYAYTSIHMHEAIGHKAGLSGTDHKYLGFLLRDGAMTAGELARLTGLTTGAITGLIDRFEKKKLVKRQVDKEDRRKVIIEPDTKVIMDLLEPLYRDYRNKTEKLIASFSEKEIGIIATYLSRSVALMEETTGKIKGKTKK